MASAEGMGLGLLGELRCWHCSACLVPSAGRGGADSGADWGDPMECVSPPGFVHHAGHLLPLLKFQVLEKSSRFYSGQSCEKCSHEKVLPLCRGTVDSSPCWLAGLCCDDGAETAFTSPP